MYTVFFSLAQLLLNKDSLVTPASIYTVFFSSLHLLLKKILSSLQLLFMQYCFHHLSFYLYSFLFITLASIYVVLSSSLQLPFIQ